MTIDQARQKVINAIDNSESCCYQNYPNPDCTLHTPEWVEREAAKRLRHSQDEANFHNAWSSALGDIMPPMTGRQVGARLAELGLRVYDDAKKMYRASQAALDDEIATIRDEKGYPCLYWNRETVVSILTDGVDSTTLSRWRQSNDERGRYLAELAELDSVIDHDAYLTEGEQNHILACYKSGEGDVQSIYRRATIRAHRDRVNGKPLQLKLLRTQNK